MNRKTLSPAILGIAGFFAVVASANAGVLAVTAVPEGGATFGLLTIGLVGLAALRRKLR